MSNFIDKIKIKTGVTRMYNHDLSCSHITTQDFFRIRPIYAKEMIPGETLTIDRLDSFVRLAPLQKPFYGSVRMINRAFFIPFRTIFAAFNNFITDTPYTCNGTSYRVDSVPYFYTADLIQMLTSNPYATNVATPSALNYDVCVNDGTNMSYWRFTAIGRHLMTIIYALGYTFAFSTSEKVYNVQVNQRASALPLFAFAKVMADWYSDPAYVSTRDEMLRTLSKYEHGGTVDAQDIDYLLSRCVNSLYDRDYFTAAFDNPLVPNDGTMTAVQIPDINQSRYAVTSSDSSGNSNYIQRSIVGDTHVTFKNNSLEGQPAPYIESKSSDRDTVNTTIPDAILSKQLTYRGFVGLLNQYMLDSLKALSDYVKRYQLVGSRTLDRYLALFGIKLDDSKLQRSVYVGKSVKEIDIADVVSTAETSDALLGQYAAKGIGFDANQRFSYHADEFGLFMIVNTILPRVGYVQGMLRRNLHIDRFDFFTPDFDALGTQAIARCELFNELNTSGRWDALNGSNWSPEGVFGYTPRYSEYCVGRDLMSGDFRYNSLNLETKQWHLNRMFDPTDSRDYDDFLVHHDQNFNIAQPGQYNRIFTNTADNADHFYLVHNFHITSRSPKKPLYEQYDFDEGRSMLTNLGGTNLN